MCDHEEFFIEGNIGRLSHDPGGPITSYTAEIKIKCTQCGLPLRWIGNGLHWVWRRWSGIVNTVAAREYAISVGAADLRSWRELWRFYNKPTSY